MTRKELDIMLKKMILENDRNDVVKQEDGSTFVEISKKFGINIGITLCGEVDKDGFHQDLLSIFGGRSSIDKGRSDY